MRRGRDIVRGAAGDAEEPAPARVAGRVRAPAVLAAPRVPTTESSRMLAVACAPILYPVEPPVRVAHVFDHRGRAVRVRADERVAVVRAHYFLGLVHLGLLIRSGGSGRPTAYLRSADPTRPAT